MQQNNSRAHGFSHCRAADLPSLHKERNQRDGMQVHRTGLIHLFSAGPVRLCAADLPSHVAVVFQQQTRESVSAVVSSSLTAVFQQQTREPVSAA